jgi:zinc protease
MREAMEIDRGIGSASDAPGIEFEEVRFPNGLRLIFHVDRKLPVVHVNQWFHVGSKNEKTGRTGFAHLFEHMMFQGSKNARGDYFQYVEKAGANLREGGVNGTTDFDRTNYFATVPSGNLEFLLWLESDRLATLPEALTQEKLDNQREVVRNERRQSYENQPYGRAFLLINENLHPAGHPYSWDVIGSHEDLIAASVEDVKEFFRTYYSPSNLSLVVAGDFDRDEAVRLVERYFGSIAPGPALDRPTRWIPVLHGERVIEAYDRVPQDRTYICWPGPAYFDRDEAPLDIAARILSDGLSSRLNRELVYEKQICTNVFAFSEARELSGVFGVVATARPGVALEGIEAMMHQQLALLAAEGPTPEELKRALTKWEYEFISGLERIGGFGGKADRLNQYATFLGTPAGFERDLERFRSVTVDSVRDAMRRWVDKDDRLVVRFRVEESSAPVVEPPSRETAPEFGTDPAFHAPHVQQRKLPNGLEIFVVERKELPKVAVTLGTRAGSVNDPVGKDGVAHLVVSTIDLGTKKRSALEIEDALGDLGTSFSGAASREASMLGFDVLRRHLEPAFEIFADVVRNASYPESEIAREKNRHLDTLSQQANNPASLASRIRPMIAFGPQHPYGRPLYGLPSTVATITSDDLATFHRREWRAASSALIFVGDITADEAEAIAIRHFGDWNGSAAESRPISSGLERPAAKVVLVDRSDAAQTIVVQIVTGPRRDDPEFYAFRLADAVWGGGGFGTRLNLNLREDKGYSYGVFSNIGSLREAGAWWAQGSIQTDKTAEAVVEFVKELKELGHERPVSGEELEAARLVRLRGFSQQFESLGRIAQQVAELWTLGLPMSELQGEYDQTMAADLETVERVAARYAREKESILLLVGDLRQIEAPVRALNLGEVIVVDAEGRKIR